MRPRQIIWILIVAAVAAVLWRNGQSPSKPPSATRTHRVSTTPTGTGATQSGTSRGTVEENHYSPEENLEQLDLAQIDGARRSLDIAMYAFTDRYLADAVLRAAARGVQVRIYRDRQQFEDEQHNAGQHNNRSTTDMFRGERNIQIRVKTSHELMHLKAYCVDGRLLRDGSANWSPSGLKRQDNNARFTTDPMQISDFQRIFDGMWTRDNEVVQ